MTVNDLRTNNSNALISFAAVIVIVYGMQAAKVLLVPFLLAVFLALIAIRPMLWLQKHKVPSAIAALAIVILMMLIIGMVGGIVGSSIAEFTAALPAYQARLDVIVQGTLDFVASLVGDDKSFDDLGALIDPGWAMGLAASILNGLQDVLTNAFLILFTMVFILLEASSMETKVQAAFGRAAETFWIFRCCGACWHSFLIMFRRLVRSLLLCPPF
jgi:predicted PurR-regulated permease PerM